MKLQTYTETRPWGNFEQFTHNELSTVKIITISPGEELSLQYHEKRSEFWKVLTGNPVIRIGITTVTAQEGDEFYVAPKENHRIKAQENEVRILEIALGDFDENDIIRIEDKYGRK